VTVQLTTETISEIRLTENIFGESRRGDRNNVIVIGAHLDSVAEGPGINDNGSGVGAILEIAIQLAKEEIKLKNRVRFAFWGAEESGLLGSEHYVANLSETELAKIKLNLNFDMLGSPNYVRFVYDGDGSDTPAAGPPGSDVIEQVFLDYFAAQGLETDPTAFDGRSDYGPFIAVGIPAGGLFSGAEGVKTPEQEAVYGGTAGVAYDPCYHQACDTFDNVSEQGLEELADAAAHAIQYFAQTTPPLPPVTALQRVQAVTMDYRGSRLVR
jgi:Zn-dependent M28 family amino/carboxypeptidase